jgi:hypothetical protein
MFGELLSNFVAGIRAAQGAAVGAVELLSSALGEGEQRAGGGGDGAAPAAAAAAALGPDPMPAQLAELIAPRDREADLASLSEADLQELARGAPGRGGATEDLVSELEARRAAARRAHGTDMGPVNALRAELELRKRRMKGSSFLQQSQRDRGVMRGGAGRRGAGRQARGGLHAACAGLRQLLRRRPSYATRLTPACGRSCMPAAAACHARTPRRAHTRTTPLPAVRPPRRLHPRRRTRWPQARGWAPSSRCGPCGGGCGGMRSARGIRLTAWACCALPPSRMRPRPRRSVHEPNKHA